MLSERSFEKWKPQLKPTSHNLLLGCWVLAPQIISINLPMTRKGTDCRRNFVSGLYGFDFMDWE
jgi:hypothetical protein